MFLVKNKDRNVKLSKLWDWYFSIYIAKNGYFWWKCIGFGHQNQFYLHKMASYGFKMFLVKIKDINVKVSKLWESYFGIYSQKWPTFVKMPWSWTPKLVLYTLQDCLCFLMFFFVDNKNINVKVPKLWDPHFVFIAKNVQYIFVLKSWCSL